MVAGSAEYGEAAEIKPSCCRKVNSPAKALRALAAVPVQDL